MKRLSLIVVVVALAFVSCNLSVKNKSKTKLNSMDSTYVKGEYGYDLKFLQKHLKPVELKDGNACVLISPEYQGRVMTSTASGAKGFSFGWINHNLIESGKVQLHINAYGGEERLWVGPEGGQFSIFFAKGVPFDVDHWFTPACIDTEPFQIDSANGKSAVFSKKIKLSNYSGSLFELETKRKVTILNNMELAGKLNMKLPDEIQSVGYETNNTIQNTGTQSWSKETGALSIWLLGMMNPSPEVTIVIPYKKGDLGTIVKDDYFGKVPADRLIISNDVIYFKADGKYRSKIGLSPKRALGIIGSYDAANKILTIVKTTIDPSATEYVNSSWQIQKEPFAGDVINSYNDGPLSDGTQMGPFYELESSSKAGFLKPGEVLGHIQLTCHFEGDESSLSKIAVEKLGVSIEQIKSVFQSSKVSDAETLKR